MRTRISLANLLVIAVAYNAQAGTLNLRWNDCFGDGGVVNRMFACDTNSGSETLVALTSWGDVPCVSQGFYYRVDTAGSVSFIQGVFDAVATSSDPPRCIRAVKHVLVIAC